MYNWNYKLYYVIQSLRVESLGKIYRLMLMLGTALDFLVDKRHREEVNQFPNRKMGSAFIKTRKVLFPCRRNRTLSHRGICNASKRRSLKIQGHNGSELTTGFGAI